MSGVELCRTLRHANLPYYVYAILVTSRGAKEEIVEGFRAGADDYLTKPFEREELKARIRAGERIVKLESDLREARSRLEMEQIITDSGVNYSEPGKIALHRRDADPAKLTDPLVRKHYLQLSEPNLDDNVSDVDRVTRALRQVTPYQDFEISLACQRELAATLRFVV